MVYPRFNKQLAMLELDRQGVASMLALATRNLGRADEPTVAAKGDYDEGSRTTVLVNRYERNPRARRACIDHYGARCFACGLVFHERYGEVGIGAIKVHHLEPLGAGKGTRRVDRSYSRPPAALRQLPIQWFTRGTRH